jgi:hypothetical protein
MNTGAFCKTEAVQTFKSLLKQRRRWFLGFITNEVCMLTDIRLWKRYPLLLVIRLAQNTIRTTALLFFILVISLLTTSQKIGNLPVGFIAVSLGLNWVLMIYFAAKLGRYKVVLYPLMFVVNPAFNWLYMVVSMSSRVDLVNGDFFYDSMASSPRASEHGADPEQTPGRPTRKPPQSRLSPMLKYSATISTSTQKHSDLRQRLEPTSTCTPPCSHPAISKANLLPLSSYREGGITRRTIRESRQHV